MKAKISLFGLPILTIILGIIWIFWLSTVNYGNEFSGMMIIAWSSLWIVYFLVLLITAATIKAITQNKVMFKAILYSFYVVLFILVVSLLLITFVFN